MPDKAKPASAATDENNDDTTPDKPIALSLMIWGSAQEN